MKTELSIQRRHSKKCPDGAKGPDYLRCRGRCRLRICGMVDGRRIRKSLKTRDVQRAARRLAEIEAITRPRKTLRDAIAAFHRFHAKDAPETKRKHQRVLDDLTEYCARESFEYVDQIPMEGLDGYAVQRGKKNWTWIKEIEILRQFFSFCMEREWSIKNSAKALKRPRLQEANDVVPYTSEEFVRILAACDQIGRSSYERLRARAMVLLKRRSAGLRISDVVTLSRDHITGTHLNKRAIKNGKWIRVELPRDVIRALDLLPHPKGAPRDSRLFFASGASSLRTLVKAAARTLKAVFGLANVDRAPPHRFRHTLASDLLGKGVDLEVVADILADSAATIRRHYAKWTPERQAAKTRPFEEPTTQI